MKTIYISGPMTGIENQNEEAFNEAEKRLTRLGWRVINPVRISADLRREHEFLKRAEPSYREYLAADLYQICTFADEVYMLKGWEDSCGANAEHTAAVAIGLLVFVSGINDRRLRELAQEEKGGGE